MSAEKKRETPELNQLVKRGIRTWLFYFARNKLLTPGLTEYMCRYNLPQCHSCKEFFLCLLDGDTTEEQTVKINCTTYSRSLREFYPKGRNLSRAAQQTLERGLALINDRPRKVLHFPNGFAEQRVGKLLI